MDDSKTYSVGEFARLAERMHRLGAMFTQGKPEIEQGLREMYRDVSQIPEAFRVNTDQALQDFMTQAYTIFQGQPPFPPCGGRGIKKNRKGARL